MGDMALLTSPGLQRAVEQLDVEHWASFYADDAEWIEYREANPPRAPNVMRGAASIRAFVQGIANAGIQLRRDGASRARLPLRGRTIRAVRRWRRAHGRGIEVAFNTLSPACRGRRRCMLGGPPVRVVG
jgi:hypothetical protein